MEIFGEDIIIREAFPEEASAIRDLTVEAMEFYRQNSGINKDVLESLTESVESVKERIRRHHCLVAASAGTPLGTITVSYCDNRLEEPYRNTGTALISRVLQCQKDSGIRVSVLPSWAKR